MSDLARSALHARIAKLPNLPPIPPPSTKAPWAAADDEDEDDEEDEVDGLGDLPSSASSPASTTSRRFTSSSLYTPISAASHFAQALAVAVPASGLEHRVYYTPPSSATGTVVLCHHGAGYTGLSFACLAQEITRSTNGELGVLAFDARSHGKTRPIAHGDRAEPEPAADSTSSTPADATATATSDSGSEVPVVDLSIERLTEDCIALVQKIYPDPASAPSLLLLGHSMGGTVLVRACPTLQAAKYTVSGVVVLDVVEGSALEAMPLMHGLLAARPAGFDSLEDAIEWHISNKTIRNSTSARISVPSMFVEAPPAPGKKQHKYIWRAPLQLTAPYWTGWFTGLSQSFLAVRTARLLILAGTDRLDKPLMIGQMQGKFQLEVIPDVGHMLHEDDPDKIAALIVEFWRRNERVVIGGARIKKVGES